MNIEKKTLKGTRNIVKEIMMENAPELGKKVSIQKETFWIPIKEEKKKQKRKFP